MSRQPSPPLAAPPVTVLPGPLRAYTFDLLRAAGTPVDIAEEVARHLVGANLAGHDSHGVQRLAWYLEAVSRGDLQAGARPEIVRERGACALFDAHRGFGHYSTMTVLEWALERVPAQGLASAAIRNSGHIGRLGEYSEAAVARGFLAIVTVGSAGPGAHWRPPFGGRTPFLGTNPWSLGVPAGERGYVYDGATTTVAEGKVQLAHAKGAQVPAGWITDREGRSTTSPEDLYDGGSMVSLGERLAGHKGSGLGLGAALFGALSLASQAPGEPARDTIGGVWMLVVDPSAFGDGAVYRAQTARTLAALNAVEPAPGFSEVLAPGGPEEHSRRRRAAGIPIPDTTWQVLCAQGERLGVAAPNPLEEGAGT